MNKDGQHTASKDCDEIRNKPLDNSHDAEQYSSYRRSSVTGELKLKISYWKGVERNGDDSLGTNLTLPGDSSALTASLNGAPICEEMNPSISRLPNVVDSSRREPPVAKVENLVLMSSKEMADPAKDREICDGKVVNAKQKSQADLCHSSTACETARPIRASTQGGSCRLIGQDVNESCLRMDVLPNVSPDSGIVSFEGSPFGNESPHSTPCVESNHDRGPSQSSDVSRIVKSRAIVDTKLTQLSTSSVPQHSVNEDEPRMECSYSGMSSQAARTQSGDLCELPNAQERCLKNEQAVNKDDNDTLSGSFSGGENEESQSCQLSSQKAFNSEANDSTLTLPKVTSPFWKKKKGRPLDVSLEASQEKNDLSTEQADDVTKVLAAKNFEERVLESVQELKDTNGNNLTSLKETEMWSVQKEKESLLEKIDEDKASDGDNFKKSTERQKGSMIKKVETGPPRRTVRKHVPKLSEDENIEIPIKYTKLPSKTKKSGRPRGRPRKVLNGEEAPSQVKKKKVRKRIFTRVKKAATSSLPEAGPNDDVKVVASNVFESHQEDLEESNVCIQRSPSMLFSEHNSESQKSNSCAFPKQKGDLPQNVLSIPAKSKTDFGDQDLESLLKSVKSSINSQFTTEMDEDVSSTLSFDNPFKSVKTPSFPQLSQPQDAPTVVKPKPKYKKPKLHVMMRKTKRRKKKKSELETPKPSSFCNSSPQKSLSFFTSCVQPSKLLATSRLNVFHTGTGVEPVRSGTPTDGELAEGSEKKLKKKRKLLNFKSKHRNISDPSFGAELDEVQSGIKSMAISENSADNYIKVRPGEMPLPDIFKVIKIDVTKRSKEMSVLDSFNADVTKQQKSLKREQPTPEPVNLLTKGVMKSFRKKSLSDQNYEVGNQASIKDSSDQRLPPKKRHRMMLMNNQAPQPAPPVCPSSALLLQGEKKRRSRLKKVEVDGAILKSKSLDQVLTIDTTSYSTAGSCVSTCSPSPCPSRHSTRSSTIPSLSSISPSESCYFRNRFNSKTETNSLLTCPRHSHSPSLQDSQSSCAECQLLRQSASALPSLAHSSSSLFRSISNASIEQDTSFDLPVSSAEPSPSLRGPKTQEESHRRSTRKRRKSSNFDAEETESSPPRLEKHNILPLTSCLPSLHSTPPVISPVRRNASPHGQSSGKKTSKCAEASPSALSPPKKRAVAAPASHKSGRRAPVRTGVSARHSSCNTSDLSHPATSSSVISELPASDWQPLPLEHCKNKEIAEEIRAMLPHDSSDDSSESSDAEDVDKASLDTSATQLPRKRYQRVGLFSDFYKDDEPRKRSENMARCKDKLVYLREEHEYGLMPLPIHVGWHYMKDVQHFQLPYDVWWHANHNQLPKKPDTKTNKFRTIRSNVYVDGKASSRNKEIPTCSCKQPPNGGKGCLDECLNRMIYTECTILNCPLGDNCGNQRIQKHEWAPGAEKFSTSDRGLGVRATKPVKANQFILEYLGEVVSETELRRRMMEEYSEECHHYALHLDSGNVIDGYRMGNIARYVNHSCQPNCEMQKWNVNGLYRMVLVSLRDINALEELTYDYNFDAFNQETQQECRCGSEQCRGVIGGKAQRNNGVNREKSSDDLKDKRKSKLFNKKLKDKMSENMPVTPPTKKMTLKERCYIRKRSTFLVRNVDKVFRLRHPDQAVTPEAKEEVAPKVNCVTSDLLLTNLTESAVKTRLATFAKDNPELMRLHQLAQLFDRILSDILSLKDQDGDSLVTPLMSLPSRKKQPQYYEIVKEPIDMSVIKQRVKTGYYDHLKTFNADVMLLFSNVELYCGPKSDMGQIILKLRQIFTCAMQSLASQIDELLGVGTTKSILDFEMEKSLAAKSKVAKEPVEDIIRCICGVTRDEGLMLQCEKCMRWQHCDCVKASGKEEHYLCDRCEPRYYDPEIPLAKPWPESLPDCSHFMTLVKDDYQYAVGDCVYVMRDCKRTANGMPLRASHRIIASSNPDSLDIFRIDQLWKDPKGERFASGTPYLRPQETFHEPTRKFLHNELFRTPNYEIIPLDLVMGKCVVMDPTTYCKGRPKGVKEQDVYVCEYRVDKTAHLFHKIKEIWYPINTGKFCFDWFETKLSLKRTYAPHEIPEEYRKKSERNSNSSQAGKGSGKEETVDVKPVLGKEGKIHGNPHDKVKMDESLRHDVKLKAEVKVNVKKGSDMKVEVKTEVLAVKPKHCAEKHQEKRQRLEKFLLKLLNGIPGKQKIDLSYLLDGGKRARKKLLKD